MKSKYSSVFFWAGRLLLPAILFLIHNTDATAQMPPPGYEREKKMQEEQAKISILDRDSITLVDLVEVFDPTTYESEKKTITSRVSMRDYCFRFLGIGNAEMLLDRAPHTVIDPKTYENITIQLNSAGKLDTIPK
ncbi:MAG: hypothetical protein ABJC12_07545 [Saprospiraceae bacterium]